MLGGYVPLPRSDFTSTSTTTLVLQHTQPQRSTPHLILRMANRGYDVVVDVDAEVNILIAPCEHGEIPRLTSTAGRSRPHRPSRRRPRIPLLKLREPIISQDSTGQYALPLQQYQSCQPAQLNWQRRQAHDLVAPLLCPILRCRHLHRP